MCKSNKNSSDKKIPCALQDYFYSLNRRIRLKDIPQESREYAFQHWIAFRRRSIDSISDEKLKCPLLACGQQLGCLESLLQHLVSCPKLADSWYRCPSCGEPETFAAAKACSRSLVLKTFIRAGTSKVASFARPLRKLLVRPEDRHQEPAFQELDCPKVETVNPLEKHSLSWSQDRWSNKALAKHTTQSDLVAELESAYTLTMTESTYYRSIQELPGHDLSPSELPSPDPFLRRHSRIPGLNTIRLELPTSDALWMQPELPSPGPATFKQTYGYQDVGTQHAREGGMHASSIPSNRRSELPRLSVVTTHPSHHDSDRSVGTSKSATTTAPDHGMNFRFSQNADDGHHARTAEKVPVLSHAVECSSVGLKAQSTPIHDQRAGLAERSQSVSPFSAGTDDLATLPFDKFALVSPTAHNHFLSDLGESSKNATTTQEVSAVPDASLFLDNDQNRDRSSEDDLSMPQKCHQIKQTSTSKGSDVYRFPQPMSKPAVRVMVQDAIGRAIMLHQLCTSKLDPASDPTFHTFGRCGYSSFCQGLQVLQRFHKAEIPSTAKAICALVQVALQFASGVPGQVSYDLWNSIQQDLLIWSQLIGNKDERSVFLSSTNNLLATWLFMNNHHWSFANLPNPSEGTMPSAYMDSFQSEHSPYAAAEAKRSPFEETLKSGAIIQLCSRFLDKFECLCLLQRIDFAPSRSPDHPKLSWTRTRSLNTQAFEPLLRPGQSTPFRQDILAAEKGLNIGSLRNVREVELMLMHSAEREVTQEALHDFKSLVRLCCDCALAPGSAACRAHQYRVDLILMQAIVQELWNEELLKSQTKEKEKACDDTKQPRRPDEATTPVEPSSDADPETPLCQIALAP
ncbi:MAG: hypothetical protein Q9219_003986 [cf. Caloplaca sp. 3 TL-2023]